MKKFSDIFSSYKQMTGKAGRRVATTALFVVAAITTGFAQDFTFIEGSVHGFKVENHEGNTFAWSFHDDVFNLMPVGSIEYIEGEFDTDVTVRFVDMDRAIAQMVHLAVTETGTNGCSTTRAIKILLEPNNLYLEFASAATQDCYSMGEYNAPLRVGLNFKDKNAGVPIPEYLFPLKVEYQIKNVTNNGPIIAGNLGNALVLDYKPTNDYTLLVTEAIGSLTQTTEYELTITSVTDKYDTEITNNTGDIRLQIRIINHLPQSGGMDMALAYELTPISYMGAR